MWTVVGPAVRKTCASMSMHTCSAKAEFIPCSRLKSTVENRAAVWPLLVLVAVLVPVSVSVLVLVLPQVRVEVPVSVLAQ